MCVCARVYTSYTYIQELKDYIRKREAQIQPLMGELNLLKDLKKEQIAALEKLQTENYRLNEALEALRRRPRSVVHTHTHTHTHTRTMFTHTYTHTHTHTHCQQAGVHTHMHSHTHTHTHTHTHRRDPRR